MSTVSYETYLKESMKDVEVRREYYRLGLATRIARQVIHAREEKGWSQQDLAERVGTKQPAIARLEKGEDLPSLNFLFRVTDALNVTLDVVLI